ncbi:hypothetical protein DFQ00_11273 [Paenibacillus barcinonensis]|uniref:DinB family protein n=1 Tax=Paenibacillus barcinonensis TaxID=198119 RepID=A0A2V4WJH5_PAEBA|nr:hypothetical protein DFQ00_11273 [Paenibacillus barcinonensis]
MDILTSQYEMIKRTRESLFRMCETMPSAAYLHTVEALGGESIRNLHVHVADCYRYMVRRSRSWTNHSQVQARIHPRCTGDACNI